MEEYKISKRTAMIIDALARSEEFYRVMRDAVSAYFGEDNTEAEEKFDKLFLPLANYINDLALSSIHENLFNGNREI